MFHSEAAKVWKALETHKRLQAVNAGMAARLYPLVK